LPGEFSPCRSMTVKLQIHMVEFPLDSDNLFLSIILCYEFIDVDRKIFLEDYASQGGGGGRVVLGDTVDSFWGFLVT